MPPETIEMCGHLASLSPREELAVFLGERGECWMQDRVYREAVLAFAWANELAPRRQQHLFLTWQALRTWDECLRQRLPPVPHFPKLCVDFPPRRFTRMPKEWEQHMLCLRVREGLLDDPELEQRWWGPARQNPRTRPRGMPAALKLDCHWND